MTTPEGCTYDYTDYRQAGIRLIILNLSKHYCFILLNYSSCMFKTWQSIAYTYHCYYCLLSTWLQTHVTVNLQSCQHHSSTDVPYRGHDLIISRKWLTLLLSSLWGI